MGIPIQAGSNRPRRIWLEKESGIVADSFRVRPRSSWVAFRRTIRIHPNKVTNLSNTTKTLRNRPERANRKNQIIDASIF
jgi:hypothetical protein